MTHIAITEVVNGSAAEWMEQVSDQQYAAAPLPVAKIAPSPSQGQKLFGDVAPKFVELTDDVLFGDVWARPGLSPRDRSLITVSALIAMNRPDQLRGHLARARQRPVRCGAHRSGDAPGLLRGLAERRDRDRRRARSVQDTAALI